MQVPRTEPTREERERRVDMGRDSERKEKECQYFGEYVAGLERKRKFKVKETRTEEATSMLRSWTLMAPQHPRIKTWPRETKMDAVPFSQELTWPHKPMSHSRMLHMYGTLWIQTLEQGLHLLLRFNRFSRTIGLA